MYNPTKAEPGLKLTIERKRYPGKPIGVFSLDNKGNGRVEAPLPPVKPTIAVKVWFGEFAAGVGPDFVRHSRRSLTLSSQSSDRPFRQRPHQDF